MSDFMKHSEAICELISEKSKTGSPNSEPVQEKSASIIEVDSIVTSEFSDLSVQNPGCENEKDMQATHGKTELFFN